MRGVKLRLPVAAPFIFEEMTASFGCSGGRYLLPGSFRFEPSCSSVLGGFPPRGVRVGGCAVIWTRSGRRVTADGTSGSGGLWERRPPADSRSGGNAPKKWRYRISREARNPMPPARRSKKPSVQRFQLFNCSTS